jgi:hypothetical protein
VAVERAQELCELENLLRTVDEKRHRL